MDSKTGRMSYDFIIRLREVKFSSNSIHNLDGALLVFQRFLGDIWFQDLIGWDVCEPLVQKGIEQSRIFRASDVDPVLRGQTAVYRFFIRVQLTVGRRRVFWAVFWL
jgi:hypothetical protein